jgi:putative ABC transport system permease protein
MTSAGMKLYADRLSALLRLAMRNLVHDRISLAVTLTGISFAVVLLSGHLGLYVASERVIVGMHDRFKADLWVVPSGAESFDAATLMEGRERYAVLATKGVARVDELVAGYAPWRKPSGGWTAVMVVGSDQKEPEPGAYRIVAGRMDALATPGAIAVDDTYLEDLGVKRLGDMAEISDIRVKIRALSHGVRAFTTIPYVFTSVKEARGLLEAGSLQASFLLVTLKRGADPERVKSKLAKRLPGAEVLGGEEFRQRSLEYWLLETGAGSSLIGGAIIGLVIGMVIVAQTLYGSTKDHLNEFATLRALGASAGYINAVILVQALVGALAGFVIGMVVVLALIAVSEGSSLDIVMTPGLALIVFVITLAMCIAASLGAIRKVMRLDPASVFSR